MSELGTLRTSYPGLYPFYDLIPFLANGWRPLSSQSAGVSAMGNFLVWSVTLIGDDATSPRIMEGVPAHLRGPANERFDLKKDGAGAGVVQLQRSTGLLYTTSATVTALGGYSGIWVIRDIIPKGTPVEGAA